MICQKCRGENATCEECGKPMPRSFISRHKGLLIVFTLLFVFVILPLFLIIGLIVAVVAGVGQIEKEAVVIKGSGANKIALINIDGIIVEKTPKSGLAFSEETTSARKIRTALQEIQDDGNVKGLLLRIKSPGGSAVASEEIYHDLLDYKQKTKQKVVVYFSDIAASGGYYVSMAGDKIVANPSTITGSIGVLISYLTFGDLAQKYGVNSVVYKSGPHKDIVSEFRNPTPEEKAIMQSLVDDSYSNFVLAVSKGRSLPEGEVKSLGDGRVYSGRQAEEAKLVDSLGTFDDAVSISKKLAGITDASVVEFGKQSFFESLLDETSGRFNLSLFPLPQSILGSKSSPQILYLYTP